ncbi:MAG TPA: hypothetical protein VFI11_15665 [Anaerolineales bacterium]|nr:hypothetical protein [Anaerolineales bacterium]
MYDVGMGLLDRIERALRENPDAFRGSHISVWAAGTRVGFVERRPDGSLRVSGEVPPSVEEQAKRLRPGEWLVVEIAR